MNGLMTQSLRGEGRGGEIRDREKRVLIMGGKRFFFLFLLLLGAGTFLFRADIQRSVLSLLVVSERIDFEKGGWLDKFSSPPKIVEISYPGHK